jgi:serine protease Do
VKFAEANDGLRVEFIVATGPAARDGLKVNDIVVGIDEIDIRDQMSLVPILAQRKAGDVVTLKVRRGNQYLDLPITLARRGEEVNRPQPNRPASRP